MFNRHILGCNALEKCLLGLIVSGLLLCWPGTASAQSPELTRAYRQGQALQKKGRYKEAIPFYQKALEFGVREFGPDHETTATLINNLAFLYNNQGRYADAEPLYKRSLAINEKALGSNHPEVAISLNNLAMLYRDQGRYADAEPLLKRALAINEKALGPDHPSVALGLNNLAALYDDQGRYADAEPLYKRSLAIREKALGPDHPDVAQGLNNLAELYRNQGRYAEAEPLYKRSLAIWEKALGPDHPSVATSLNNLAALYDDQGRYDMVESLYKRSLTILAKALGPNHPRVATSLNNLAELYRNQGRYAEAEPLYKRSLAIREKALGPNHPDVAISLNNFALLHHALGRYAEAELLYKRSLEIDEKALGPEHPDVAQGLNNLAVLYVDQGRYGDAEPLYKRVLLIFEKALGPGHPDVAQGLNNLALLYKVQGRYGDAEPLFKRSLEIDEKALGPDHPNMATDLNNLAALYVAQGHYANAEPLYKRSLAIREKALGPGHPDVAQSLNNLAALYDDQGRYANTEPLYKRSLAINEKALGPDHPSVALGLNNLAALYDDQGRYADAEPLYKRSLAIREKALGPEHPDVALSLNNLAALYDDQGRYADAEPLYKRSLAIWEKALGPDHPSVALGLNNLAALYVAQGRYGDAEPLFKRSLAIREKALGPGHPDVAGSLNNLAALYEGQGKESEGLELFRRATVIHQGRAARPGGRSAGGLSEQKSVRFLFTSHVRTAANLAGKEPSRRVPLTAETFAVGQLARATQAGAAVSRMAARFAAGNDDLAETVRGHQDAVALWQRLDADLIKVVSAPPAKRNPAREKALRERLDDLDARIAGLSKKLAAEFPDYAELAAAKPVPLGDVQKLFNPEEALVAYLVSDKKTYVWAVRRDRAEIFVANIDQNELSEAVARLRGGLDPSGITRLKDIPPFNRTEAYKLYKKIFAPAEPLLDGARHVFVVADGALESLPLGVLVTEEPQGEFKDFSGYRQVPWLAKKYALSTLPSVSSLRALRTFAKAARAKRPFIGFGDPVLEGRPGEARSVSLASLYRGAIADVEAVRQLSPLPDTANELRAMATILHADEKQIYLREAATETAVKSANLSDIRVLAFATHGLVGGEFKGNVEPALVLTPPKEGTAEDDGLLTASEVATLKLNADLVILSACNTAAPDGTPEAEGLSGLAKAFFYAGSRALLVSHWPVASDAAVKLTTGMLERVAAHPERGRADALRRSMLALMEDIDKPHYAHPMFWAPFVVVGEGGTPVK